MGASVCGVATLVLLPEAVAWLLSVLLFVVLSLSPVFMANAMARFSDGHRSPDPMGDE